MDVFDEVTRTFIINKAADDMPLEEMAMMTLKEHKSDTRQQQVKDVLDLLRLSAFMAEKEI